MPRRLAVAGRGWPTLQGLTVHTPGGLINSVTAAGRAMLADTADPLSILTQLDSLVVNGEVFTSSYDAVTRRATSTTPEGRQSITRTNHTGRIVSERTVGLDSVSYAYDTQGRLEQVRRGGRTWTYSYDVKGRLKSTLDPLGRRDSLFYDDADRLTRRGLPGGREVLFAYDSSGNVTAVTPPGRTAHGFGYTPVDLTNTYTPPNVGLTTPATTYSYNADRQLTRITRPDSVAVIFDYDTAGRPSAVTFDRGQLTYGYSPTTGNLTSITAPGSNTLSYTYDGTLPKTVTWAMRCVCGTQQRSPGLGGPASRRLKSVLRSDIIVGMTLGELAHVLDVQPKWVLNVAAVVGRSLPYTVRTAQRLAVARALVEATGMPMPRAYKLAIAILKWHDRSRRPVRIRETSGDVVLTVDVYRILAAVNVGLSRLRTRYQPGQRGRPISARPDPIQAAREYGLDLSLLRANLGRTPAERLRQLDAMVRFRRRVRRGRTRPRGR